MWQKSAVAVLAYFGKKRSFIKVTVTIMEKKTRNPLHSFLITWFFATHHARVSFFFFFKEDDSNVLLDLNACDSNGNCSLPGLWASVVLRVRKLVLQHRHLLKSQRELQVFPDDRAGFPELVSWNEYLHTTDAAGGKGAKDASQLCHREPGGASNPRLPG